MGLFRMSNDLILVSVNKDLGKDVNSRERSSIFPSLRTQEFHIRIFTQQPDVIIGMFG